MRSEKLKAVLVSETDNESEYYTVGKAGVTQIEWGSINGHMAELDTIRVFKGECLHSEHPFSNCLSVYFEPTPAEKE